MSHFFRDRSTLGAIFLSMAIVAFVAGYVSASHPDPTPGVDFSQKA